MTSYTEHGYKNRQEYLQYLSENYNIDISIVTELAELLGPEEDFDGLISMLDNYNLF